jgi:hypothetical protein
MPLVVSSIFPPIEKMYDNSDFQTPSRGLTAGGQYGVVLVESGEGELTVSGSSTTSRIQSFLDLLVLKTLAQHRLIKL